MKFFIYTVFVLLGCLCTVYTEDVLEIFVGTPSRENYYKSGDDVILMCIYSAIKNAKHLTISAQKCNQDNDVCHQFYSTNGNFVPINGIKRISDESVPGMIYLTIPNANPDTSGRYQCKMQYKDPGNRNLKSITTEHEDLIMKTKRFL